MGLEPPPPPHPKQKTHKMVGSQDPTTLHVAPPLQLHTSGYPQHPTLAEYTMVSIFFLGGGG